ncbi:ribokinase [Inhella inkyongensis]|uniref:Ribokinase n=1 Tax=Inhella inkyongensis TaxID=392593 RepID=A0A840S9U5_9BURK|nr:ribokinase [Inhella inkyongensis]MBB5206298.1 ribokinase [Inhella inkyongensis]
MKPAILVLGSVNRDLIVHAPRLPQPGETLRGQRFGSCLGGKGANQAVAAARLGAAVALAARIGQQENGAAMVASLRAEGVDVSAVLQPADETPGVALIVVGAEDGENQIVTVAGSNGRVSVEQVDALELDGVQWLVLQQELPLPVIERALERARQSGVRSLLNAAPFREEGRALLPRVDVLVVNETEAEAFLRAPLADPIQAARALRALGPLAVLLTLGSEGAVWVDGQQQLRVSARKVQAVDTVGAGDTLVGALVTALSEGQSLEVALQFSQAAAAWAVSHPGVQDAMPRRAELDAWMEQHA